MIALLILLSFYVIQYNGWNVGQQENEVERKPYKTGHFLVWVNPLDPLSIWIIVPPFFRDDERGVNILRNKPLRRLSFTLPVGRN